MTGPWPMKWEQASAGRGFPSPNQAAQRGELRTRRRKEPGLAPPSCWAGQGKPGVFRQHSRGFCLWKPTQHLPNCKANSSMRQALLLRGGN